MLSNTFSQKSETLDEELRAEIALLKAKLEQSHEAYERLQQRLNDLLRHRFGKRSERCPDPNSPQLDMFMDEFYAAQKPVSGNEDKDEGIEIPAHRRTVKKRDTSHYPREIKIISVPDKEKTCACGCEKVLIRYETKELFDYQPAVYRIIEQRREVVACPKGCQESLQTAPAPLHILPKTKATESLLAQIVISKMHHRQPLYHLEKYVEAIGASRETMARWVIQLVEPLQPLFNLMKDDIMDHDIASIDATTLQVLKEPGRPAEKKSYVYCIRGGPPSQSVILYDYNHRDHSNYVDDWLEGFQGKIHMDAGTCFHQLLKDPLVKPSFCNAHARRKFEAVMKQAKKQGLAHEAIRFYKKLYRIERRAKDALMSPQARYQLRQEESRPIVKDFKWWLDQHYALTLPQSPLGQAFAYTLKHWEGLTAFLDDGRLEIDNNLTEQEIKPFVIARKNFMFSCSMAGAKALCLHFSLIRTALAHGLDPYRYYVAILKKLPDCKRVDDYEKLLPWTIDVNQ